ncbi:unnamed protein product, partial [Ectocarpus fasciculatus]
VDGRGRAAGESAPQLRSVPQPPETFLRDLVRPGGVRVLPGRGRSRCRRLQEGGGGDPRERPSARGAGGLGRAEGAHRGGRCRLEGVPQGPSQHHRARHVPQVWFCFALFVFFRSTSVLGLFLPSIFRRRFCLVVLLRSSNFLWSSSLSRFCHIFRSISSRRVCFPCSFVFYGLGTGAAVHPPRHET